MSHRKATLLIFAMTLLAGLSSAQQKGDSSPCAVQYENHNQVDYGPLIVQEVRGTVTDPEKVAVPKVCVGIFTEKDHKLVATAESDAGGKFSLQTVPPGRYRLVLKADPLCAANVPLQVVKRQKKKQVLRVHMKPRGLDSCSYADLGTESAAGTNKSSQIETDTADPRGGTLRAQIPVGASTKAQGVKPAGAWLPVHVKWEHTPPSVNPRLETGATSVLYFDEQRHFAMVECVVNREPGRYTTISRGDGQIISMGEWDGQMPGQVKYRLVSRTVPLKGETLPGPWREEQLTSTKKGYLMFQGRLYRHAEELAPSVRELLHGRQSRPGR